MRRNRSGRREPRTAVEYAGSDPVSFGINILQRTTGNSVCVRSSARTDVGVDREGRVVGDGRSEGSAGAGWSEGVEVARSEGGVGTGRNGESVGVSRNGEGVGVGRNGEGVSGACGGEHRWCCLRIP